MNAIIAGAPAHHLSAYLPFPKAGKKSRKPSLFTLESTATGLIMRRSGAPVAWIYPGYHNGHINRQPHTCRFVDVAYHRQTEKGVNLETADFLTLQEAFDFVVATFGTAGGEA